ncbi:MAG: phosphoketolase family protein [Bacilli bacterium]|nr:phosphoketolase family protein [Bacilli bacterium]
MNILTEEELSVIDRYFRAANYLSVCQMYLLDNPLLKRPLALSDIKKKLVGHWGTVPGQNFVYTHLNRVINKYDLDMIYISGPGHGGQASVTNVYLEGTYSEIYPNISEDEEGLKKLCKQFSFPGGISSHAAPETPGSINEGGELGYSLAHAYGAVFDNPNLIAACVVGDGEAETGALATSWHSNKFINPKTDGAVLPILHLNGYKIANPTVLARISRDELLSLFRGYGYDPYIVSGDDPLVMHEKMASTMDKCITVIKTIWNNARSFGEEKRPKWPMIILETPKGWTGPKVVDGKTIENSFRSHQVPIQIDEKHLDNLRILEDWLRSYHPEELFDDNGRILPDIKNFTPVGDRRMGANPHANGGKLLKNLRTPDFEKFEVKVKEHGSVLAQDMMQLGKYVEEVVKLNENNNNFRIFGPDEALSNRLNYVFNSTNRQWECDILETDEYLSNSGRVMDAYLSEHLCEGWLEGYLLTGRHGFFHCYEAFIRVVDSMVSQHAKWLKVCHELPWREEIASLNYVLTSHIWQQDHNGFTHQDPGFLNHLITKKADITRIYLPPDANCLLSCFDHCIKSRNYINAIVASKHPRFQWLSMEEAIKHCTLGISIWDWASNDKGYEPDIVMACCGDTPTLETLAAVSILHKEFPNLRIRTINVVDLMKLQSNTEHPHGMDDLSYDMLFTKDKPIIFNFHGYPSVIHELVHRRHNNNIHVHGYIEEGTITTPFDMRVQNHIDRFHLVMDALKYLDKLGSRGGAVYQDCLNKLIEHKEYIKNYGVDMDIIENWKWKDINDEEYEIL